MAKGQKLPIEKKLQIIEQVKLGIPISELALENNLNPNTIYAWLSGKGLGNSNNSNSSNTLDPTITSKTKTNDALTIARLIREKQELTEIIGRFAIQIEKSNSESSKKKLNFRTS